MIIPLAGIITELTLQVGQNALLKVDTEARTQASEHSDTLRQCLFQLNLGSNFTVIRYWESVGLA